jgi:hypothetical protein
LSVGSAGADAVGVPAVPPQAARMTAPNTTAPITMSIRLNDMGAFSFHNLR